MIMQASKLDRKIDYYAYDEQDRSVGVLPERKDLTVLFLILCAHLCLFLPICFQIGFYLDDWLTFWNLHFAPHNFFDLLKASFNDPRMVTRPVQCFYYASTYFFFGDRPLPYHLLRLALEYCGAVCLYFGIKRLSMSRFVAAASALFFLLYPSHDSTHYWIGGGLGPGFGLTLYLASFSTSMKALIARSNKLYILSIALYVLSAFCYEAFLPMLVLSFCGVLLLSAQRRIDSRLNTMSAVILWFMPFILFGLAEPVYQRFLLPRFTHVFLSPSTFDPAYFLNVFVQGLNVSLFAGLWSFLAERIRESIISFTQLNLFQLVSVLACSCAVLLITYQANERIRYRRLFTAAIVTFFASYLTFALAEGYTPVLNTMINRVNIGASVAVSLIIALGIKWVLDHMHIRGHKTAKLTSLFISMPLVLAMVLANLSLSSFWILSWQTQKNVRWLLSQHQSEIRDGDCILLADTNRYLNWAPVFDGTWDFQSMLRMTLNNNKISGGVVCERLQIKGEEIQDISAGFLCASYPSNKTTVFFPSQSAWLKAKNSRDFINCVESKSSHISLPPSLFENWRKGAATQTQK